MQDHAERAGNLLWRAVMKSRERLQNPLAASREFLESFQRLGDMAPAFEKNRRNLLELFKEEIKKRKSPD